MSNRLPKGWSVIKHTVTEHAFKNDKSGETVRIHIIFGKLGKPTIFMVNASKGGKVYKSVTTRSVKKAGEIAANYMEKYV